MSESTPGRPPRTSARPAAPDQLFFRLWQQGGRPDLRSFLSGQGALSPSQAAAVISIDQFERWRCGERVRAEDYLALLPDGPDADQAACDVVYGEYLLREQLGEHPTLDEYERRFPAQASLLARQVELHQALALETPGHSVGDPTSRPRAHSRAAPGAEGGAGPPAIPGYELLEPVGRGGMGVVYRARQLSLDRVVALKVLHAAAAQDPAAVDRMRREARVMARLSHPHIVTVHDAGQAGEYFYFAMEFVDGIDLHRLVEHSGPLPGGLACELMRQAALGLQHAHEQGLVHRDIKPSNLIVTPAPPPSSQRQALVEKGMRLKVLDLGLARLAEPVGAAVSPNPLTQVGAFMGTPDFVAPEQANDPRCADVRSDLYSLGCTFYYVLTGQAPFAGATPLAKLMQHHLSDAPLVEDLRPELAGALAGVIRKLMAKRPEERYGTPAELAAALAAIQAAAAGPAPGAAPGTGGKAAPSTPAGARPAGRAGLVRRLYGHTDWVKCVAFRPTGGVLASGGLDGTVRLWLPGPGEEVGRAEGHASAVLCLAFAPDGRSVVSGGQDRLLCLWDLREKEDSGKKPTLIPPSSFLLPPSLRWQAAGHDDNVNAVSFSPDGGRILSASHDGTLRLWQTATGRQARAWRGHDGPVWAVAFAGDGRRALSGGQDRMVRLWDVETGESLLALPEQAMIVTCVALSPDGRHALSAGMDGVVRLWDLQTRRQVRAFEGHAARVTSVAFSPDGRRVASGSRDRSVRVFDASGGQELYAFTGHTHWVTSVAWAPDGVLLASGSVDRTVAVWEAPAP
jgi:hypothetical protein